MSTADDGGVAAGDALSESEPWEPLSIVDVSILGLVGTLQVFALLVCVHLVRNRRWPPYVTKNPILVVIATFSGVLWTITMAISAGYIKREQGDILAACDFERFLSWSTLCVHTVAFFIRVYRMWRILIKHDNKMWHTEHQILFMSSVSLVPVIATWVAPHSGYFDEVANTCSTNTLSALVVLFMDLLGFLAICFLWFVCARQLKTVRKQFNEYDTMKRTLLYMTITLLSYAGVVVVWLADDLVMQRRVAIFYPLMTTYILLWGSIREPFIMKMLGDDDYLWSYTKGFAELPSPAQLKASLAEQLSVDQLREEFRRYVKTKVAQELVDFYLDSLDREEVKGFFERQAVTMRIVEQYIREGAPDQVNISGECREAILATDVTAFNIFDEARKEVLEVMETNFRRDFVETEGYQRILDASEEEQRELRMLRAGGILPLGTPSTPSPAANKTPAVGSRRPAGSPSLLAGVVDAVKKLPFLVSNARAASERRRRRSTRVGGAAVGAASVDSSGSGERGKGVAGVPVESDLALARRLQREEEAVVAVIARDEPRGDPGGAVGAVVAGDVEMGEGMAGAGRSGAPEAVASWRALGGGVSRTGGGLAGETVGYHANGQDGGSKHIQRRQGDELSLGAAMPMPQQVSSGERPVSASGSGLNPLEARSSDSPSVESPRGIPFSSWLSRRGGGGGGGDGRRLPSDSTPAGEPSADVQGGGQQGAAAQEEGYSGARTAVRAAAGEGMAHSYSLSSRSLGNGRGFTCLDDADDGNSSNNSSPAGMTRLGQGAFGTMGFEPTFRRQHGAAAAVAAASPTAYHTDAAESSGNIASGSRPFQDSEGDGAGHERPENGGGAAPGLTVGALEVSDRASREDGVEGLEALSPVVTEDSPNWVLFSEWIENGGKRNGEGGGYGGGGGGRGDGTSASAGERQTGRWYSDESSWSSA